MPWAILLLLSWVATASVLLAAPVLVLFADDDGRLPDSLAWAGTSDNTLDGDQGWKTEHLVGWPRYVKRVVWLWRNPAYVFEERVLGAAISPDMFVTFVGNPFIKNREHGVAGSLSVLVGDYWCHKRIWKLPGENCLMAEFGWKLQPYAQDSSRLATEPVAQFVCSVRITAFLG